MDFRVWRMLRSKDAGLRIESAPFAFFFSAFSIAALAYPGSKPGYSVMPGCPDGPAPSTRC